jgi:hypothetical protein
MHPRRHPELREICKDCHAPVELLEFVKVCRFDVNHRKDVMFLMPSNIVLGSNECFPCLKIPSNTTVEVLNDSTAGNRTFNYTVVFNRSLCCLGEGLKGVVILDLASHYFY